MARTVYDKLRALQDVLSKKFDVEKEIQEIPKSLATKTELLNRLKKSFMDKSATYQAAEARVTELGQKLTEAEQSREGFEGQMDVIKTQREYEALDKEIKDATEREGQLRKELQREQASGEELKGALEKEEMMIRKQEEDVKEEQSKIKLKIKEKNAELKKLQGEEKKITPGLDEDILFKFERIIKSKSGLGIVSLTKGVCTGCYMILPPQFVNTVRLGERVEFCPYCSRILFYQEDEEGESLETAVLDEVMEDEEEEEEEQEEESPEEEEEEI
ncbi:MAG TPA: C4-type zinc ribbon domain-containing protein [Spirochaetia bacterium]|nr:C4-type zinc ribbon domain-containing protein [Spirochaetia bacterium]